MTHFFDYPTLPRNHAKRAIEAGSLPGSDKCPTDYYAVLRGLLLRGGYRLADLQAEEGAHFKIELGFLRRIQGATIELGSHSASARRSLQKASPASADNDDRTV